MGLLAFLAIKYGVVTDGKYKGSQLAIRKSNGTPRILEFIDGFKVVAKKEVLDVYMHREIVDSEKETVLELTWDDDTTSTINFPKYGSNGAPNDGLQDIKTILKVIDEYYEEKANTDDKK